MTDPRGDRRHRSSNERETPYRRAVAATWRGACKLSRTILSFSSSDQRRRRPVSTTSSRSTWALRLSLSIRTVLNTAPYSARRPSADGYSESERLDESPQSKRATKAAARRFNIAFTSRKADLLLAAFAESLRLQANVSHFASKTNVSREALYRIFTGPRTPRFTTVLSFLNALGLRFAVRRVSKNRHWAGAVLLND